MLKKYKEELEELTQCWSNDAKEKSERILNTSLSVSKEVMAKLVQENENAMANFIQKLSQSKQIFHNTERVALFNIVASIVTLMAALITFLNVFF